MTVTLTLTAHQAAELRHKLDIVVGEPDLLDDYQVTAEAVEALVATLPTKRGTWTVPDWAVELVRGEAEDIATVRDDQAHSLVRGGQYAACRRDVRAFDRIAEDLS